jgi:hypothetical protein
VTTVDGGEAGLDIREKLAHIDLMLAQHDRVRQEMLHDETRIGRVRQEMRLAPWAIVVSSMTAGAAFFAAAFALGGLVMRLNLGHG